jgi:hypothetical protein
LAVSPLKEKIDSDSVDSLNTDKLNILSQKLAELETDIDTVQDIQQKDLEMPLVL